MKSFFLAARPKTLPAAIVPVWVGCVLTVFLTGTWDIRLAFYTVMGSICIQIATNFFNDAIDSDKGADTDARLGPVRATASGQLSRRTVYISAIVCLLLAAAFGVPLFIERGWPMLVIGRIVGLGEKVCQRILSLRREFTLQDEVQARWSTICRCCTSLSISVIQS